MKKFSNLFNITFKSAHWNRGHPDIENQSDGRTETIDSNILKSSQSNVWYKAMKSQLVRCDAYAITDSFAAVFWDVTQRVAWHKKTAAEETSDYGVA